MCVTIYLTDLFAVGHTRYYIIVIIQILSEFHGVYPMLEPQLNVILISSMDHIADVSLPLTVDSLATYLPTLCQLEWRHGVRVNIARYHLMQKDLSRYRQPSGENHTKKIFKKKHV